MTDSRMNGVYKTSSSLSYSLWIKGHEVIVDGDLGSLLYIIPSLANGQYWNVPDPLDKFLLPLEYITDAGEDWEPKEGRNP